MTTYAEPTRPLYNSTYSKERIVTARKQHRCDSIGHPERIEPGDRYLIATEYPGGDSGYASSAGHPVRLKICAACSHSRIEVAS